MVNPARWIIGCRKGARPSEDELALHGFRVVEQHEHEDGVCVLVEPVGALAPGVLDAVRSHPAVTCVEPDHPVDPGGAS